MARKIKILLSKLGLDVHNRGLITVAKELRDAGMEVVYIGNALPDEIIATAIQEDVDVVGVSSLGGAHLALGRLLLEKAHEEQFKDGKVFVMGGVFSPEDGRTLEDLGFDGIFPPGSAREEIVESIRRAVANKTAA